MSAPTPPPSVYCPAIGDRVRYSPSQIGTAPSFEGTCDSAPFLVGITWCVHLRGMDLAYRDGERSEVKAAAITNLRPASAPLVEHEDMGRWKRLPIWAQQELESWRVDEAFQRGKADRAEAEVDRLKAILNTPELASFSAGVTLEAVHQRERWGSEHDGGKAPSDWFWLLGYLSGKALEAHVRGDLEKARHHTISSAAVLANWHAAISGTSTVMRPGIEAPERALGSPEPVAPVDGEGGRQ